MSKNYTENLLNEIDVLRDVSLKLEGAEISFMITGSMAMNYYAQPRMTRDIDIVISIHGRNVQKLLDLFRAEYYISEEAVRESIQSQSMFNVIHNDSIIKIDFILLKNEEFQQEAFQRRQLINIQDFQTSIICIEDLILSKLIWSRNTNSQMQVKDIKNLLTVDYDDDYLENWVKKLGLESWFNEVKRG